MRIFLFLLLFIIIVVFTLTFATSNPDLVTMKYYGLPEEGWSLPLWQILLGSFLLGVVVGAVFFLISTLKAKTQLARTRRRLVKSEKDLEDYAPAPVRNDPI